MADFIAVDMVQLLSNAAHQVGRGAVIASYVDEEFKDPSFIAYRRVTDDVAIGDDGLRAAERGHWQGEFRQPDGSVKGMRGLYQAGWVKRDGRWQVLTEAYLRLDCGFESNCRN